MQMPDVGSLLLVVIMLGLLPFAAMVVTSYTKIVVVLGLLRNAIGVQQVPPNMVLNGVALLVSCFVMAPVGMEAFKAAQNYGAGSDNSRVVVLLDACREPFRQFLLKHTREREKPFHAFRTTDLAQGQGRHAQVGRPACLGAGLHAQRIDRSLPHRLSVVSGVYRHRPGGGQRPDGDGPFAGHPDQCGDPIQAAAVCRNGWLVNADSWPGSELSVMPWTTTI